MPPAVKLEDDEAGAAAVKVKRRAGEKDEDYEQTNADYDMAAAAM